MPAPTRAQISNPLVNTYRTQDGRFVSLCMLQSQRYWPGFCKVAERAELEHDPRFATAIDRARNVADCVAELDRLFAGRTLATCRERPAAQDGPWDVLQHVGDATEPHQGQTQ